MVSLNTVFSIPQNQCYPGNICIIILLLSYFIIFFSLGFSWKRHIESRYPLLSGTTIASCCISSLWSTRWHRCIEDCTVSRLGSRTVPSSSGLGLWCRRPRPSRRREPDQGRGSFPTMHEVRGHLQLRRGHRPRRHHPRVRQRPPAGLTNMSKLVVPKVPPSGEVCHDQKQIGFSNPTSYSKVLRQLDHMWGPGL